jgi:hypothetical protein
MRYIPRLESLENRTLLSAASPIEIAITATVTSVDDFSELLPGVIKPGSLIQ